MKKLSLGRFLRLALGAALVTAAMGAVVLEMGLRRGAKPIVENGRSQEPSESVQRLSATISKTAAQDKYFD